MKIMFLNCWYARTGDVFYKYIKKSSQIIDVFAFTEVSPSVFKNISRNLPNHNGFYDEGLHDTSIGEDYGQAFFVRKGIEVKEEKRIFTFRNLITDVGFGSVIKITTKKLEAMIINVHGKARPGTKVDTPARIKQSERLIESSKKMKYPVIIGGDFNLNLNTKSVNIFEENGFRNLIKEFDIKSTRNKISWDQFKHQPEFYKQYFADYCFVSPKVKVKSFEVPYNEVSDHLSLVLDFEL